MIAKKPTNQNSIRRYSENYYHLSYSRMYLSLLGIWPMKLSGLKHYLYEFYYWSSIGFFCLFVFSQAIEMVISFRKSMEAFATVMGVTIGYATCILKVRVIKSSRFVNIIRNIRGKEQEITSSYNEDTLDIYLTNVKTSKRIEVGLISMVIFGAAMYYIVPIIQDRISDMSELEERSLIVQSWFPFDRNEYYWVAYGIQCVACFFGTSYMFFTQAFYLSVLRFVVGQLRILSYYFKEFTRSSKTFRSYQSITRNEEAESLFLKRLIRDHQDIIRLVVDINIAMKNIILLEFAVSSIQLAMVVYQILHLTGFRQFAVCIYCLATNIQLYLSYWSGNEILYESERVAMSIAESDWNTYPAEVLKMMQFVMMRAQKPLRLEIGSIGYVQFATMFQIYKAIYSYLCLFASTE